MENNCVYSLYNDYNGKYSFLNIIVIMENILYIIIYNGKLYIYLNNKAV